MNITKRHLSHGAANNSPNRVIVHAMAEYIDDGDKVYHAVDWLDKLGLSAHILVGPDEIFRCREDNEGAYHAKGNNSFTLGIEFLVPGVHDYGTFIEAIKTNYINEFQYGFGLNVVRDWFNKYLIEDMQRHSDIDPGRKVDPGAGFPWDQFRGDI